MGLNASSFKERLRAELKASLRARKATEVGVIRTLIAAIDNAEAVRDVEPAALSSRFGDGTNEVSRLELDRAAVEALLAREVEERLSAAAEYERRNRMDDAARLREEAALVSGYLDGIRAKTSSH